MRAFGEITKSIGRKFDEANKTISGDFEIPKDHGRWNGLTVSAAYNYMLLTHALASLID